MKKITQISILSTVFFTLAIFSIQTASAVTIEPFVVTAIEANGNDVDSSQSTEEKLDLEVVFNSSQASTLNIALLEASSSLDFSGTFLNFTNTPWQSFSLILNNGATFTDSSDINPLTTDLGVVTRLDDRVVINFELTEEDGFEFGLDTPWQINTSAVGIGNSFDLVVTPQAVPVPAAIWLFGTGLIGLFAGVRQQKK